MKFSGLTKKGRLYLAKIQAAEEPIQFTKIKFGDGKLSEHENPADLVDIKNIKVEKSILNKEQKEDAVILTTIIDNVGLVEGYFPRETGIYVQDEDQEVLYFYMNDGDETSWLPPEVDGPHKMEMKINLISSNTGSVLVHNDGKDLYITKDYLESNYTQKGNFNGTAQDIEDRVVAAVGKEDGKFPLTESVAGNIYYFPGNKKFYYCLKSQTSRVSVPNADFEELSIYQNRKKLENLSTFKIQELYSTPAGVKFTIFQYGSLILIAAYTYGAEKLNYGTSYKCNLPYDCYNTATAITGNNASSGQFSLVNNVLIVNSTDNQVPLKNTFMGQLTTFLK